MAVMRFDQVQRFITAKKIFCIRGILTTRLKSLNQSLDLTATQQYIY